MKNSNIRTNRLENEFDKLLTLNKKYHCEKTESTVTVKYLHRDLGHLTMTIQIPEEYPFTSPNVKFDFEENFRSNFNVEEFQSADFYLGEPWSARHTFRDIIEISEIQLPSIVSLESSFKSDELITDSIHLARSKLGDKKVLAIIFMFSIVLRVAMGFGSYSGKSHKPKYGDYEAQRHWMELTTNIPPSSKHCNKEWYVESRFNNFTYWRLDYPPLTAYHSYAIGKAFQIYEPEAVIRYRSRGYETPSSKFFMRFSVIVSEMLTLLPAFLIFFVGFKSKVSNTLKYVHLLIAANIPPLLLIDHGHFQYNTVMLGS